jgi:hypothetical protein
VRRQLCLWKTSEAPSRAVPKRWKSRKGAVKPIPSLSDCLRFLETLERRRANTKGRPLKSTTVLNQWRRYGGRPNTLRRALRVCKARHYRESFTGPWLIDLQTSQTR